MKRSSGILLPISSLPSPYGIGTFGKASRHFVDFLKRSGQRYWQVLPLGPTSYGDSPYQSFSTFAGNPYLIDLDLLAEDGLLTNEEIQSCEWGEDPEHVDYYRIYESRLGLLAKAKTRGFDRDRRKVAAFIRENESWLPDYALFMACKRYFEMKSWLEWPDEKLRLRNPETLEFYREKLKADIELFEYVQYLFFLQWKALRAYIHRNGIRVIGDLPIYVALDSADLWSNPQYFELDSKGFPLEVSGVPPDYFTAEGQLWGNPVYDWEKMKADGYDWWIRRVGGAAKLYDVLRLDHFRGFESYWAVPYGEKTAVRGEWKKGPGMDLLSKLKAHFPKLIFIAEDLGILTPAVGELLQESGWPGMKVLEFACNPDGSSVYLPHCYDRHCVCYTGTHDNSPLLLWKKEASPDEIGFAVRYFGLTEEEGFGYGIIRAGMESKADLFVTTMQDYLELSDGCRLNRPGVASGNWQWRMFPGKDSDELAAKIHRMTKKGKRSI